MTLLEV